MKGKVIFGGVYEKKGVNSCTFLLKKHKIHHDFFCTQVLLYGESLFVATGAFICHSCLSCSTLKKN